jgi:hypothetical protein
MNFQIYNVYVRVYGSKLSVASDVFLCRPGCMVISYDVCYFYRLLYRVKDFVV